MALSLTFYKQLSAALTSIPLFLHIFGLTMIYKTSRSSGGKRQFTTTFYSLISLSISEILCLIPSIFTSVLTPDSKFLWYFTVYQTGTSVLQMTSILIFMTSERLLRIYLGINYPLYWNVHFTKRLVAGTFVTLNVATVPLLILKPRNVIYFCMVYFHPIIEALILIHFFACYSYIFWKVKKSRSSLNYGASTVSNASVQNKSQTIGSLNKVPFIIVFSFILLVVVPEIFKMMHVESYSFNYTKFLNLGNFCMDALVYIWLTPRIKKRVVALFSCFCCCFCCCCRRSGADEIKNQQATEKNF